MSEKPYLTKAGYTKLQQKAKDLEAKLRATSKQKGYAAEVGGNVWHDNFFFEQLEREEQMLSYQLRQVQEVLGRAAIVPTPVQTDVVRIGLAVEVEFADGRRRVFTIGGYLESAPSQGLIAYNTPVGKALIGAEEGETRSYEADGKKIEVTVFRIFKPEEDQDTPMP